MDDHGENVGHAAMVLTKLEMDIVCSSEKLSNLNVLLMNVATRESELEVSLSVKEEIPAEKGLEFDFLCGILDSEVNALGSFFSLLYEEIVGVREVVLSGMGEHGKLFEEKLRDCEESLKQSLVQLDEMKMQSAELQKNLSVFWNHELNSLGGYAQDAHVSGRSQYLEDKVQMQTGEQQRNVLRLLEKSLARELDLDMKLNEARQIEEDLKLKLHASHHEASYLEEEATNIWSQCLEAEYAAAVLMGISKDLLGQLQLEGNKSEVNLQNTEVIRLEKAIEDYEGKLRAANGRAETAEAKCTVLEETNTKLNEELNHLKDTSCAEKEYLEKQLKDIDLELQHKLAAEEASQENQTMLNCMVGDMENLIKDLKEKVINAEYHADGAEAKCHVLSKSNAELNKEVSFLRNRMAELEASVQETNKIKVESAKNIEMRAKVITSLVMQLATERERLHEQLISLAKENKALVVRLQMVNKSQSVAVDPIKHSAQESYFADKDKNCGDETTELPSRISEIRNGTSTSSCEGEARKARFTSDVETVRTIDARVVNIKHLIVSIIVMLISVAAYSFHNSYSPL